MNQSYILLKQRNNIISLPLTVGHLVVFSKIYSSPSLLTRSISYMNNSCLFVVIISNTKTKVKSKSEN